MEVLYYLILLYVVGYFNIYCIVVPIEPTYIDNGGIPLCLNCVNRDHATDTCPNQETHPETPERGEVDNPVPKAMRILNEEEEEENL